ncbi:MAG: glycosyltransferase family 4 protein [Proteobacteria bacterium]|nr:glycosyltransferase family 4 protein [Pseudomonadota bacterium]
MKRSQEIRGSFRNGEILCNEDPAFGSKLEAYKSRLEKYNPQLVQNKQISPELNAVNHVMSNSVESRIFNDILSYFKFYGDSTMRQLQTERPIDSAKVYHYHRPNLEKELLQPAIVTVHHDIDDTDRAFKIEKYIDQYRQAQKIICLNSSQKGRLQELGVPKEKLELIPHGYDAETLRLKETTNSKIENDKINIGLASKRYGRRVKGEAYFFELSKRLSPEKFEFTLVGEDRTITAMELRKLNFSCRAFDYFPYRLMSGFYSSIDFLLMCSLYEGGPANIPEAIATGTPIFSTPVGISKDMINDRKNGFFLTNDPERDAININDICLGHPDKLIKIKKLSRLPNPHLLSWEEVVKKHLLLYQQF